MGGGRDDFDDIVAGLQLEDTTIEIPDRCRDCAFMRDGVKSLATMIESNEQNRSQQMLFNTKNTLQSEQLKESAERLADMMEDKQEGTDWELYGVDIFLEPNITKAQIIAQFLQKMDEAIEQNVQKINKFRERLRATTGECAGAMVWQFVEDSSGGAVASTVCNAPDGALVGDEDDGNARPISSPRKFSAEEWQPYRDQISRQRRG